MPKATPEQRLREAEAEIRHCTAEIKAAQHYLNEHSRRRRAAVLKRDRAIKALEKV